MNDARAFLKNGKESEARAKYRRDLIAERLADWTTEHIVTKPMQRGLDLEPAAREAFEVETGLIVDPPEFVIHPQIFGFGATPDGFIDDDALLEIKVPLPSTYVEWMRIGTVPEDHVNQLLAQLACARRKRTYFAAYCPEMRIPRQRLFIREFTPTPAEIKEVEDAAELFLRELDLMWTQITAMEPA